LPSASRRLIAGAFCHLLTWCCLLAAQDGTTHTAAEPAKPGADETAAPPQPKVEEAEPALYWLKDKQGALVPVPGFSFENFERLYKLEKQLAGQGQPPRFSLQDVSVTGTAGAEHADVTVNCRVQLREDRWVRVPLRFDQAVLREPAGYKGPGEQDLQFEADGEGYVSWIRGQANQQHELTLKMLVPLVVAGDETRLKLLIPRATRSELKLKVPVGGAVGKVSEGAILSETKALGNNGTEFTVSGLGGDFELTWRKTGGRVAESPTVLEASGAVLARIDRRSVESEATLSVRSYGAPFERFRVRLPPGAKLVAGSPSRYTVKEVEEGAAAGGQQDLVEVHLANKTSGPVEVRLNTHRPHTDGKPDQWVDLAGFEVEGAKRQWGTIAVAAPGDWQVLWGSSDGLRQTDQLPDALPREDVVAGYDYFAQPYALSARLVPKRTRINVEPDYRLRVEADRVQLRATLKYTIRGAKVATLQVALPGWERVEPGPDTVVAVDGATAGGGDLYSIPLLQPTSGQIEVRIDAQRPITAEVKSLRLRLPQPRADSVAPALVSVTAAENVELTPRDSEIKGLVREEDGLPTTPEKKQPAALRYRGEASDAAFAADFCVRSQRISVAVTSRLVPDEQAGRREQTLAYKVEQTLAYKIAYEPAEYLIIEVPRSLAKPNSFAIRRGKEKEAVAVELVQSEAGPESAAGPVRMRIVPKHRIGPCEFVLEYPVSLPRLAPDDRTSLTLPLVMPGEGELSSNKFSVTAPGLRVEARGGPWKAVEDGGVRPARQRGLQWAADRRADQVDLALQAEDAEETGTTVVGQAWVQTWLTGAARQDRVIFRFTSNQKELDLSIPAGADTARMVVLLERDGKRETVPVPGRNRLAIPLSQDANLHQYLLELQYNFREQRPAPGRLSIDLPRLGHNVWTRRLYWQLILPQNEHVMAVPAGFTSESTWQWAGGFFCRKALATDADLERWIGVSQGASIPEGSNCYLFGAFGNVERCELRTAGRAWIVLLASGAALVVGLLLIYVPASRHPATLLGAATVLLCLGLLYPQPVLLLSQAASLGLGLTILAGLLARSVARRRRTARLPEPSTALLETGSAGNQHQAPAPGSEGSTQSAPAIVPTPNPDANA